MAVRDLSSLLAEPGGVAGKRVFVRADLNVPVKGGVVGLQWAVRMHGFGGEPERPERQPLPPSDSRP